MSVPVKGRTFPNSGRVFPTQAKRQQRARIYARAIADTLNGEIRRGASIKTIMGWTGAGERTVKIWLTSASGPRGEHLIGLICSSEAVFERVLTLSGREPIVNRTTLQGVGLQLAGLQEAIATALA